MRQRKGVQIACFLACLLVVQGMISWPAAGLQPLAQAMVRQRLMAASSQPQLDDFGAQEGDPATRTAAGALSACQDDAPPTELCATPGPAKHSIYLPTLMFSFSWQSPFGVQSGARLTNGSLLSQTVALQAGWVRIGPISWRLLQPNQGDPIRWHVLSGFEQELRAL